MAIDHAVSRAVFLAHALERAIHDAGPWHLDLDGVRIRANREIGENGVVFSAAFPAPFKDETRVLSLVCDGQVVASRPVDLTRLSSWIRIDYELTLPTEVRA